MSQYQKTNQPKQRYFEHLLSGTLCLYVGGKGGIKRLRGLTGRGAGTGFEFTKEGFKQGFKEVETSEVGGYFEGNTKRTKIILPRS